MNVLYQRGENMSINPGRIQKKSQQERVRSRDQQERSGKGERLFSVEILVTQWTHS